jgi:hypothetical protein
MWMASFGLQTERVRFGWMEGTIFIMTPLMLLRASLTSTPWDSQERGLAAGTGKRCHTDTVMSCGRAERHG